MKNLILICGGVSPEHDISIRSAKNILGALDRDRYNVRVVGIAKSGKWLLMEEKDLALSIPETGVEIQIFPGTRDCFRTEKSSLGKVDVVFPILHGPNGEDGTMQGLLKLLRLPFVGPGVLSSAISMDKDVAKKVLEKRSIKVAKWILIRKGEEVPSFEEVSKKLGEAVFVKPANMGSSVGVGRATSEIEWRSAIAQALLYDRKVLAEERLEGREIECAVMGNTNVEVSGVGEVRSGAVYSFDEKYSASSSAQTIIPAEVSESELRDLQQVAEQAYQALECEGLSRVDMFLTEKGDVYVNEVNTLPGFTSISMYPKLWSEAGISYSQLLDRLITLGIERS